MGQAEPVQQKQNDNFDDSSPRCWNRVSPSALGSQRRSPGKAPVLVRGKHVSGNTPAMQMSRSRQPMGEQLQAPGRDRWPWEFPPRVSLGKGQAGFTRSLLILYEGVARRPAMCPFQRAAWVLSGCCQGEVLPPPSIPIAQRTLLPHKNSSPTT